MKNKTNYGTLLIRLFTGKLQQIEFNSEREQQRSRKNQADKRIEANQKSNRSSE